jgi:hypothetical protein
MVRPVRSPSPVLFANKYCYILLTHHEDNRDKWPSKRQTFTRLARVQQKNVRGISYLGADAKESAAWRGNRNVRNRRFVMGKGNLPARSTQARRFTDNGNETTGCIRRSDRSSHPSARCCDDQAKPRTRATMPTDAINACESTRKSKGI